MSDAWKPPHDHSTPRSAVQHRLEWVVLWMLIASIIAYLAAGLTGSPQAAIAATILIAPFGVACLTGMAGRVLHLLRGGG